jgi:pimeloyl-ACP methyl ester carboxylesterase
VSLVGQSLGGVYARELAVRLGDRIDRVIMLGAPTFHPYKSNQHNRLISTFGYWLNRQTATGFAGRKGLLHWEPDRPTLPCVAIHSPLDGVVDETACHIPGYIVTASSQRSPRENIRVLSSHIGMCVSPWVLLAVADRLLADRNHWRDFDPRQYFPAYLAAAVKLVYPGTAALMNGRGAAAFVEMHQ